MRRLRSNPFYVIVFCSVDWFRIYLDIRYEEIQLKLNSIEVRFPKKKNKSHVGVFLIFRLMTP